MAKDELDFLRSAGSAAENSGSKVQRQKGTKRPKGSTKAKRAGQDPSGVDLNKVLGTFAPSTTRRDISGRIVDQTAPTGLDWLQDNGGRGQRNSWDTVYNNPVSSSRGDTEALANLFNPTERRRVEGGQVMQNQYGRGTSVPMNLFGPEVPSTGPFLASEKPQIQESLDLAFAMPTQTQPWREQGLDLLGQQSAGTAPKPPTSFNQPPMEGMAPWKTEALNLLQQQSNGTAPPVPTNFSTPSAEPGIPPGGDWRTYSPLFQGTVQPQQQQGQYDTDTFLGALQNFFAPAAPLARYWPNFAR